MYLDVLVARYSVRVKPKSSKAGVTVTGERSLEVRVHSAPEDGRANQEVIERIADHFKVRKRDVVIVTGAASRQKIVDVEES